MQDSLSWQPIHENHAIDVMAVKLDFADLLPALLLRKALRVAEEGAFAAGLRSRHSMAAQPLPGLSLPNSVPNIVVAGVQGQFFNATMDTADDQPLNRKVGEQLQVDQSAITYRTWRYVSWSWQLERLRSLVAPVLDELGGNVAITKVQLEYLDKFRFDGPPEQADVRMLFREATPLVVPHVFSMTDLWHSHTGAFVPGAPDVKRLKQINVDAINLPPLGDNVRRWVNIVTLRSDAYSAERVADGGPNAKQIFETLETMHDELKVMLSELISEALADRIYLQAAK